MNRFARVLPTQTSTLFASSTPAIAHRALVLLAAFMCAISLTSPQANAQSAAGLFGAGWHVWSGDDMTVVGFPAQDRASMHCISWPLGSMSDAEIGATWRAIQGRLQTTPPAPGQSATDWWYEHYGAVFINSVVTDDDAHPAMPACKAMANRELGAPPVYVAQGRMSYTGFVDSANRGTEAGLSVYREPCECGVVTTGSGGLACSSVAPVTGWDTQLDGLWMPLSSDPARVTYCARPR